MRKQPLMAATACAGLFLCVLAAGSVRAQTYKADDIIRHFGPAAPQAGATRGLGVSRGLCVGTEAECSRAGQVVKPASATAAFDLVVKFKYNSDILESEAKVNLDEFAKALKDPQLASSSFLVEGHTDASGTPSYNLDLSQRRAQSVVRYLNGRGIDTSKLLAKGYGESKPVVPDRFSGDNRRVETRLRAD